MSGLVNDLMEISRFDAGVAELNRDEIDLAESVRRTVASRWRRGQVEMLLPGPGVLRGRVDPRRLDVVTANLVGNALRHGEPPVRLTMEVREEGQGTAWAVIRVTDSGPGIAEEAMPHIFERFYKAGTSRTRSESSGLGLAITAENVRLHGGASGRRTSPGAARCSRSSSRCTTTAPMPASAGAPGEGLADGSAAVRAHGRCRAHGVRRSPVRCHRGRCAGERHDPPTRHRRPPPSPSSSCATGS
ncbi:hypothetical protein SHKM778_90390 [Streptomyces sp. KM77-8]|uniref:histidine kinase n=1 Tax=Streptomyces haneummycinicus TaxID=3074435 RepID=A0AAT9HZ21_9ACTN